MPHRVPGHGAIFNSLPAAVLPHSDAGRARWRGLTAGSPVTMF